jgi:hypothetical protein
VSLNTRRALYGKLAGDTTLNNLLGTPATGYSKNIYYQVAPEGAAYPLIVFSKQAGTPTYTLKSGHAAIDTEVWMVKGVDRSDTADRADAIQSRLDTLLTDGALTISGASQLDLARQSDIDYLEDDDGEVYRHAGSLYRLLYSQT